MTEHQFGARLAELRHRAGLSWAELGRRSGLTPEGVSLIERGKRTNPALSTILALARALDDPRMPEDIRCHRNKALCHAYMRGMRYCWAGGRRLAETFRFGMNAARYDPQVIPDVLLTAKQFADEASRPNAAAVFSTLNRFWLMANRARRRAREIGRRLKIQ